MQLAHPLWLLALALPPLLAVTALLAQRFRRKRWDPLVASRLRDRLLLRTHPALRWISLGLLLSAAALLTLALSRPQGHAGTQIEKSIGRNVLVALDISRSMRATDVQPDRLSRAKVILYELLEALPNERIGLIGFAGTAYLYAPLTIDHAAVRETAEQIDESWATRGGSDLADALRLAIATLKETGQKNNALVFLSDGEHHDGDLEAMVSEAERAGVYIFAVGLGTEDGGFIPNPAEPGGRTLDEAGRPVLSRLQPEVMRSLATRTGGRYVTADSGQSIPDLVKAAIQDLDSFELEGRERKVTIEFYQWALLPAILLLMASIVTGTTWRGKTVRRLSLATVTPLLAAAGILLAPTPARAETPAAPATPPSSASDYEKRAESSRLPNRSARYRLAQAGAAYREGDFRQARGAYSAALLSDEAEILAAAHLGLGNTLFQTGWQNLTSSAELLNLAQLPDMESFDSTVMSRLEALSQLEVPEEGETEAYTRLENTILQWSDAIRHFQSASQADPSSPAALENRDTSVRYLRRLRELLEQEEQDTQESMPEPAEGPPEQGQPQPGEGEPQENQEGQDGQEPQEGQPQNGENENESGNQDENPEDREGDGRERESDSPPRENENPGEREEPRPDESPEDRARRILSENADLEKGPLRPGRWEFRPPEKDW
jgi:Ca-activated chloride channel homolog